MVTSANNCEGCNCVKVNDEYKCLKNVNGTNVGCEFRGIECPQCSSCGISASNSNSNSTSNTGTNSSGGQGATGTPDSFQIISKVSCTNEDNTCNFRPPFSELTLHSTNPSTGKKYTQLERNEKIGQFTNMCNLRGENSLGRCCDPNDDKLNNLINRIPDTVKEKYPFIIPQDNNGVMEYKVCKTRDDDGCSEAVVPTVYNYCKMLHPDVEYNEDTNIVKKLANDCVTASCSNDSLYPFIADPYSNKFTNYEDFNLVENLKIDNLDALKEYFKRNPTMKYSSVLKYGYPGNTTLHECIIYKAEKCIAELLTKSLDFSVKNKDGNTVLHLACLSGNINLIYNLLRSGADINIRNNLGDVAIHCAVRSASYGSTMLLISNGASLFQLNSKRETPLFIAATAKKRNIKIVDLLVKMGSELLVIDDDGRSLLKVLEEADKTMLSEQIRTLIQRSFYEQYKDDYKELITNYPEYSIMDMDNFMEKDEDGNNIGVKELPDLVIEYPDEFETQNLYRETEVNPIKVNMPQYKELSGNQSNNDVNLDYSNHNEEANVVSEEDILESFADFNNKKTCKINWIVIPVLFIIILLGLLLLKV